MSNASNYSHGNYPAAPDPMTLTTAIANKAMATLSCILFLLNAHAAQLAFSSNRSGRYQIYTLNTDTPTNQIQITFEGGQAQNARNPAWSSNDRLLYDFGAIRSKGIFQVDLPSATGRTEITTDPTEEVQPSWHPDGRYLAFSYFNPGNNYLLAIKDSLSPGTSKTILSVPGTILDAAWSPTGDRIAYSSNARGNPEIAVVSVALVDGTWNLMSEPRYLTTNSATDVQPTWSPDGSEIAWTSTRSGGRDIYRMNTLFGEASATRLTTNDSYDGAPSWSPDGEVIAFVSERSGDRQIYLMPSYTGEADTNSFHRITELGANDDPTFRAAPKLSLFSPLSVLTSPPNTLGAHEPLEVDVKNEVLASAIELSRGVVADGLTPVLVSVENLPVGSYDIGVYPYTAGVPVSQSGKHEKFTFSFRSGGKWTVGTRLDVLDSGPQHVLINPINIAELPELGYKPALEFLLVIGRPTAVAAMRRFDVALPPIVLVHGYNADGSTWGPEFLERLMGSRPRGFIIPIEYGTEQISFGNKSLFRNTYGEFEGLAKGLSEILNAHALLQELKKEWAVSRFDVVAHSQGGVLMRYLATESSSISSFRSAAIQNRGRFNRIITLNSPHNGAIIPYYISKKRNILTVVLGAARVFAYSQVFNTGVFQPAKFDPWGDAMNRARRLRLSPDAKFHTVATTLEGEIPLTQPKCCRLPYVLLGEEMCLSCGVARIAPNGTDGIVSYESQIGGVGTPSSYQARTGSGVFGISHSPPHRLFGVESEDTATRSRFVAQSVLDLLSGPDVVNGDPKFGKFNASAKPDSELSNSVNKLVLDDLRSDGFVSFFRVPGAQPAAENRNFDVKIGSISGNIVISSVAWNCYLFGREGVAMLPVDIREDLNNKSRVRIGLPVDVKGTVVLFPTVVGVDGVRVLVEPKVLFDSDAGSIVGIECDPPHVDSTVGVDFGVSVWKILKDGERSLAFLPGSWRDVCSSRNSSIAEIGDGGVKIVGSGETSLSIRAFGFEVNIPVKASLPFRLTEMYIHGVRDGAVQIEVSGGLGSRVEILRSRDLVAWEVEREVSLDRNGEWIGSADASDSRRFFRARVLSE